MNHQKKVKLYSIDTPNDIYVRFDQFCSDEALGIVLTHTHTQPLLYILA